MTFHACCATTPRWFQIPHLAHHCFLSSFTCTYTFGTHWHMRTLASRTVIAVCSEIYWSVIFVSLWFIIREDMQGLTETRACTGQQQLTSHGYLPGWISSFNANEGDFRLCWLVIAYMWLNKSWLKVCQVANITTIHKKSDQWWIVLHSQMSHEINIHLVKPVLFCLVYCPFFCIHKVWLSSADRCYSPRV